MAAQVRDRRRGAAALSGPFVNVGVTGHRNLASRDPALAGLMTRECRRLARTFPRHHFRLLSGLAEGADRLVARIAGEVLGASLTAVLPLPAALYARDFPDADSAREFHRLLSRAQRVIEAPLLAPEATLQDYGEPRNHQYAWAGAFIARRADVLIALWDGAPARGTGGTAQVIHWFRSGAVPRRYAMLRAPRLSGGAAAARLLIHIDPLSGTVRRYRLPPRQVSLGSAK